MAAKSTTPVKVSIKQGVHTVKLATPKVYAYLLYLLLLSLSLTLLLLSLVARRNWSMRRSLPYHVPARVCVKNRPWPM